MNKKSRKLRMGVSFLILFCAFIYSKNSTEINNYISKIIPINYTYAYSIENIPEYTDKEYIIINNNEPYFTEEDYTLKSFEKYSDLDLLGRCGVAYANVGIDTMPTTERGSIGMIKPTGWHTIKYDIVNGKYLYNRCHLIGYQLTGENDNEKNLITCTRQMNIGAMLEYENKVADYVKKTNIYTKELWYHESRKNW